MLAKYMRRMPNNNLEIRIAGSSCPPQLCGFKNIRIHVGKALIFVFVYNHFKITKIVHAFWLVKNLWFIVPLNSYKVKVIVEKQQTTLSMGLPAW